MEKFLAILLALCMVFSLAACSGGGTGNSPPASNTRNGGRQTQQPSGGGDDPGDAAAKEITLWTYPIGNWGQEAVVNKLTAHCMAINVNAFEAAGALQYADLDSHTWTTENFFKAVQALNNKYGETVGALFCSGQGGDPEKTMTGDKIAFISFPSGTGASSLQGGIWGFGIFNNGDEGKIAAARQFIKYYGVLNYLLKDGLHVIDKSINWPGDSRFALGCIIVILLTTSVGQTLVEAAQVDGATNFQVFWRIKWPQMMPTTINSFQCFALIQLLTSGGSGTNTVMYYIYYTAFKLTETAGHFGYANAMGVVLALLFLFPLYWIIIGTFKTSAENYSTNPV